MLLLAYASQFLPMGFIGNIRHFFGLSAQSFWWTAAGALLVSTGLSLANGLALLLAVMAGQRYEMRRLARWTFFAIAALGTLWAGAQFVMSDYLVLPLATLALVAGSVIAGWRVFRRQKSAGIE
ncbi:hypothetical protein BON30_06540 [Cystobacter ferrugineus]|uniref:Uncharacterized protein n=1 Tax=Cystobacter ferrugineus TaxID=83449 RepID=A0A1L9BEF9_9BACT|nr:hypothetical protein BON30_06540 [Cystobacter ferrugineus]